MLGTMHYYDPFNIFLSEPANRLLSGGVKDTKSTVSPTVFLLEAMLGSFWLIDVLFCPAVLGTHFQCSPYQAVNLKK